jgi:riboflavin synthase alpha subunit
VLGCVQLSNHQVCVKKWSVAVAGVSVPSAILKVIENDVHLSIIRKPMQLKTCHYVPYHRFVIASAGMAQYGKLLRLALLVLPVLN